MANWTEEDYRAAVIEVERAKGRRGKAQEDFEPSKASGRLETPTQKLSGDSAHPLRFMIPGKVYSLKNSRQSRGNYTVRNPKAEQWLQAARASLVCQWRKPPAIGSYHVHLWPFYADRRWHLDACAVAEAAFDALKGVVVPEDSPTYLAGVTVHPLGIGTARLEIALEVLK